MRALAPVVALVVAACGTGGGLRDAGAAARAPDLAVRAGPLAPPLAGDAGADPAADDAATPDVYALRAALDVSCEGCHEEIAEEWRRSTHAAAATHPVYVAEHRLTNAAWCNACHAPLADRDAPSGRAAERGVGCLACHAPHDGRPHPEAPEPRACAGCHDAPFPTREESPHAHHAPGERLQRTAEEWRTSAAHARGLTCVGCHLPTVAGADGEAHAAHGMPGGRDDALWRDALDVDAAVVRTSRATRVRVSLRVRGAGHAVPTGDMFRQLVVRAECDPAADAPREPCAATDVLRRTFGPSPRGTRQTADTRVPADGRRRVVWLSLPPGAAGVRWSVTWRALDADLAEARGLPDALVAHAVAGGALGDASSDR